MTLTFCCIMIGKVVSCTDKEFYRRLKVFYAYIPVLSSLDQPTLNISDELILKLTVVIIHRQCKATF